eukprot:CAMPEP_0203757822 /NCGR_PEP_ID=MMETSP0098-20131031/10705_1 /ASSEMBLY_ACC=CAM_ASM_000208 /TAXON_ID=96639 /ORGANISM=" , Strain NY0313808BC1" /LENGTH=981 /DNA_ID=CAMNT_0050650059 /DNA_START=164 /DNA_END=3106 /DNA_ORIENTATION=-
MKVGCCLVLGVVAQCVVPLLGLFEDQAGVNDWYLSHVGQVSSAGFYKDDAIVATNDGVIASVQAAKGGNVKWRVVLAENDGTEVSSGGMEIVAVRGKRVFTISKDGCTGRMWLATSGGMIFSTGLCSRGGSSVSQAKYLPGDVNDDSLEDVLVLAENRVQLVSGSTGVISWKWERKDSKLLGVSYSGNGKKMAGHVVGRDSKGLFAATIDLSKGEADSWAIENMDSKADPVILGHHIFVLNSGSVVSYDLTARKAKTNGPKASSISVSSEHLLVNGAALYQIAGDGNLEKILDNVAAVGSGVNAKTGHVATVGIVQQGKTGGECGPITSVVVNSKEVQFPEEKARDGQRGVVTNVFVDAVSEDVVSVVTKFADDSLVGVRYSKLNSGKPQSQMLYVREEALGGIISTESIELPLVTDESGDSTLADEIAELFTHGNAVSMLLFRLKDQVRTIRHFFTSLVKSVVAYADLLIESGGQVIIQAYKGELKRDQGYSHSDLSSFGFRRGVLLMSKCGKIFLLDSMTGATIWSVFDPELAASSTEMIVTRYHQAGHAHPAEVAFVSKDSGRVMWRNAMTGAVLKSETSNGKVLEVMTLPHDLVGDTHASPDEGDEGIVPTATLILVHDNMKFSVHPKSRKSAILSNSALLSKVHFAHYDSEVTTLNGYGLQTTGDSVELWGVKVPKTYKLVSLQCSSGGEVNNPGVKLGDGSVLVKSINPHLILLAMENPGVELIVTLMDGVSGRIVKRFSHRGSTGPFHSVIYDNMIVYTFWSTVNNRVEVSSVGLFEGAIDKRALNLWTPRSENDIGSGGSFSSFDTPIVPSVLQRTFFLDKAVRSLGVSTSRFGISDRNVFFGLENGGVNMVPRVFLDPRRPMGKLSKEEQEEGLVAYFAQLPLIPTNQVTYNLSVAKIDKIISMPTKLESTTLILVTGLDLFFCRVMPSKGFDLLDEDFNFSLLLLLCAGLVVATVVLSRMVRERNLADAWK